MIEPETGTIRVAPGSNLDPDLTAPKTTRYDLSVRAIDSGTELQRSAEVLVNITIIDVNNKPPVFVDPGTVTLRENTPVIIIKTFTFKCLFSKIFFFFSIHFLLFLFKKCFS